MISALQLWTKLRKYERNCETNRYGYDYTESNHVEISRKARFHNFQILDSGRKGYIELYSIQCTSLENICS